MKVVAIVQARMGSTRLPNKVMKLINGVPMIELLLARLARAGEVDEIVLATSEDPRNRPLIDHVAGLGYRCWQGSENDVLDRYLQAARGAGADVVVRITGDCPLTDPAVVNEVIRRFKASAAEYCSNTNPPTYPDGLDVEVFSVAALERAARETDKSYDHEHVTPYLKDPVRFGQAQVSAGEDYSALRWTVDEAADFAVVEAVFSHFAPDVHFNWASVLELERSQPNLFAPNKELIRNEGATLGTGQKLWKRAKNVIPGGNMLLSKRAEMFLPNYWPAYFSKAKDCRVWDLDGREYTDMSIMGIGTNILGYGHPEVDEAVRKTVEAGNMSTLNCPEEVYLAERLVELHPWADMVRFARSGGEANAIAIRIARAAAGRSKVAFCGYHGWHDWYLAANLGDKTRLVGHLLPGLEPNGVPENLRDTIYPVTYNRFEELEAVVRDHDIGVIMMEVSRNENPRDSFLEKVRSLASQKGIVLIFDECTSGFRESLGGLHKVYGVEPDMAIFGKALGNGYAITATIGRREVMQAAQSSFISSTFWTERIGPTAGLKTLEVMDRTRSYDQITRTGQGISAGWERLAQKHGLQISISGLPSMTGFGFPGPQALAYKTLITQEMLSRGYLASTGVYVCTEHTPAIVDAYFEALDPVFGLIAECENGRDVGTLLKGPTCHGGFRRLN
jgi:glutamate-1-semialdehyde 2,1-aminomutase